jgi:cysteinyl-tRNA synthetase
MACSACPRFSLLEIDNSPQRGVGTGDRIMTLTVYNTMTRQKEAFQTLEPGIVRMYVCGVTPYSDAHVGHGLSAIVFDVVRRYLEWSGYTVLHAQNFTDIDDKIITRSINEGIEPLDLVNVLIDRYKAEIGALNNLPATFYPRATEEVPHMIEMIEGLIERGFAYEVEGGDVNYAVSSFDEYGKLSHRKLEDLLAGARIEVDERKRHPMDFALWKAAKPGEPSWDSPWGQGRPGWHIECSVMARRHLGNRIDIHGGGADLIFPHHENEIAQSEAFADARPFSRYWMHNALLQLGGEKMSKSIGNLVNISEIVERGLQDAFRFYVLQTHYRHPLTYSDEGLDAARRGLDRLRSAMRDSQESQETPSHDVSAAIESARAQFFTAMDDDFNTPVAVSVLFDLARQVNQSSGADKWALQQAMLELAGILGLRINPVEMDEETPGDAGQYIDLLVELRTELRAKREWELADTLRDRLTSLGVTIEDTPTGSTWRRTR